MQKYETDLEGYEPLKYLNDCDEIVISNTYKINVKKVIIINSRNQILKFNTGHNGYCSASFHGIARQVHRVVWNHINGIIPNHLEIDHIDENRTNNKIENLQLLTHRENLLKAAKNRNYEFVSKNHQNKHIVKIIDTVTLKIEICPSLYSAAMFSGVNCGIIKMCCDKTNKCKSGISKLNNHKYTFEYTNEKPTLINKRHKRIYEADKAEELNEEYMKGTRKLTSMVHIINRYMNNEIKLKTMLERTQNEYLTIVDSMTKMMDLF